MASGLFNLKQQLQGLIQKAWAGSQKTPAVEYLVVAGGGGGGGGSADSSGGGGGGGLLTGILPVATGSSITVTVGGGGASNTNGQNSVFGSITATGGGKGAVPSSSAGSGGSGGGGSGNPTTSSNAPAGSGTSGQGNAGGTQTGWGTVYGSAGGGGAGTVGLGGNGTTAGNGGAGIASAINGTVTTYAGGGGGGIETTGAGGSGGVGGGGAGGNNTTATGTAGTANTGGGGGGSGNTTSASGGTGGSGIVIISYPDIYSAPASFGGANSPTASTSGSGSLSFNGSTSIQAPSNTVFSFGTGDFTIELWVYPTSASWTSGDFYIQDGTTVNTGSIEYYTNVGRYYNSTTGSGSTLYTVGFGTITANAWTHLAIVRISGTTYLYKNGALSTSASDSFNYGTQGRTIGSSPSSTGFYVGYISNYRVVKGVGVYTGAFTPSIAPLNPTQSATTNTSAITGTQTSYLLNNVSGAYLADSSTNSLTSTILAGTPSWNQASPFATGLGYKNRVYTWTGSGTVTF